MSNTKSRIGEVFNVSYHSYRDTTAVIVGEDLNAYTFLTIVAWYDDCIPCVFWLDRGEVDVLQRNGAFVCGWNK